MKEKENDEFEKSAFGKNHDIQDWLKNFAKDTSDETGRTARERIQTKLDEIIAIFCTNNPLAQTYLQTITSEEFTALRTMVTDMYEFATQLSFQPPLTIFLTAILDYFVKKAPTPRAAMTSALCLGFALRHTAKLDIDEISDDG